MTDPAPVTEGFTYRTEFPDFPQADLPAIPPHWLDSSWHNDACPSFQVSPFLAVFVDFADVALSEFPEWRASGELKRCTLKRLDGEGCYLTDDDDPEPAQPESDDWNEVLAACIADEFARGLREILSADEFAEMRALNATPAYADGCCASHNHCDANMPMADAFDSVMGRPPLEAECDTPEHESDCQLWNRAWDIARTRGLIQDGAQ